MIHFSDKRPPIFIPGSWKTKTQIREAIQQHRGKFSDSQAVQASKWLHWAYPPADMIAWGQRFLPELLRKKPSPLHHELAAMLWSLHQTDERGQRQRSGIKRARIAPRSYAKTAIDSKLDPLFAICHGLEKYILIIGATAGNAEENLKYIKDELEGNELLAQEYPWACGRGETWNVSEIITRNNIRVQAVGRGGHLRGRGYGAYRPTHVIMDDLENEDSVMSPEQRRKTLAWINQTLLPLGDPETNFVIIGTALHREDALHKIKETPGWDFRSYQALVHEPVNLGLWDTWKKLFCDFALSAEERARNSDLFYRLHEADLLAGAEILWPEQESLLDLMKLRATAGEAAFQSEKQGQPFTADLCEWPADYFGAHIWFDDWPELKLRVIALDPSKGKSDKNDYGAFVLLGLGVDGKLYVEADIARRDVSGIVADGITHYQRFRPQAFAVEINQMQELFQRLFEERAQALGLILPTVGIHNNLHKPTRIRTLGPLLRERRFRFKRRSDGTERLIGQMRDFPLGAHDDGPDALEMALRTITHLANGGSASRPPLEDEVETVGW